MAKESHKAPTIHVVSLDLGLGRWCFVQSRVCCTNNSAHLFLFLVFHDLLVCNGTNESILTIAMV